MPQSTAEPTTKYKTMRALVFDGALRLGTLPCPTPEQGEVLVKVSACGISRADVDMIEGRRAVEISPAVLGHQFVGRVSKCGEDVDEGWLSKRIVGQTVPGCGRCGRCRHGITWQCEQGLKTGLGMGLVDGAFAEYTRVPASSLVEVIDDLDDVEAVFVYPVASLLKALETIEGAPPQRVLVVGDGNMGLLATFMAHAAGHAVSVLGRHPSRRELLWRSGIGFVPVPDEALQRPELILPEVGDPYGYVIECSGRVEGLELAAACLRPRGCLILVSDHVGQPGARLSFFVRSEIEMVGVGTGPLQPAMDYLATQVVDVPALVDARASMLDGISAFERASRRGNLRTILTNDGTVI
jgi:threonine dehydrogenase-like Zn-dependent dehydrogenase